MKIPDKCKAIYVLYEDGTNGTFIPKSKIEEFEDCYEFEEKNDEVSAAEASFSMVVIMKSEIRVIKFAKD
jgi:hypothetical protein